MERFRLFVVILIFSLIFLSTCTQITKLNTNILGTQLYADLYNNTTNFLKNIKEKSLSASLKVQNSIMKFFNTNSIDLVFVSDPFFALYFFGDSITGYQIFYELSQQNNLEAMMYVLLEKNNTSMHNIELGAITEEYALLNRIDLLQIRHAKQVVVSPLLKIFAPEQLAQIAEVRAGHTPGYKTLVYDSDMYDDRFISVDYSQAMSQLGQLAAEYALKINPQYPVINILLDSLEIDNISKRLPYLLDAAYQTAPNAIINQFWDVREINQESNTVNKMDSFAQNSVIVIDAGIHTIPAAAAFIQKYATNSEKWKQRILVIQGFSSESKNFKLPLSASVEIPYFVINGNNLKPYAIYRRLKY